MNHALAPADLAPKDFTLRIDGMTCASCVARVEKALKKVPGVRAASVNLATEQAVVQASSDVAVSDLKAAVEQAGYLGTEPSTAVASKPARLPDWWPVAAGVLLTAPLAAPMLLALFGVDWTLAGWLQVALATIVQFGLGARFYVAGWKA